MSSRQEEKERRRKERIAAEQAAAKQAKRRRNLQLGVAGLLGVVAIAAVVVAVVAGGGGGDGGNGGDGDEQVSPTGGSGQNVSLPERQITDLNAAARAAGCVVRSFPEGEEQRDHSTESVEYATNPPAYGEHNPVPAQDGIYDPGNAPPVEQTVHTLEHGRIIVQYRPGLPEADRLKLESVVNEQLGDFGPGYHMVLMENQTNMPYEVAATAWAQLLGCRELNDKTFDAIRAFREAHTDKAPEVVP
jgi:hypothetical protein